MSRRRAAQQIPDVPPSDLHRAALERRNARMGTRSGRPVAPQAAASTVDSAAHDARGEAPPPLVRTSVAVAGMTCRACEVRIQRHVGRIPGVETVSASAVHGRVTIDSRLPVPRDAIAHALGNAGYALGRNPWLARDRQVWLTALAGAGLIAALVVIARLTGVADRIGAAGGDLASGGLAVALVLGLTAGVSTCMALVGGLLLALSAAFAAQRSERDPTPAVATRLRPAAVFLAGRIAGYAVLGAGLGAVGATIAMPPMLTAILMISVGLMMALLGMRLTGLSPKLASWSPTLPMGVARTLGVDRGAAAGYSDARAAALGAASFFLPCGFTQAVQVFALSTGSPVYAGAIMAVFAIGTAPGLLALAGLPLLAPTRYRPALLRLAGVAVIAFALVNATSGLRLAGISVPGAAPVADAATSPAVVGAQGVQELTTYQDLDGYSPGNVAISAGIPTRWTVESRDARSCAAFLVVPELGIQVALRKGANEIELPPLPAGTLNYTCSMGMYGGQITILEAPEG
jgi:sulfite exporter TauE/SafE/copper chaperone CopZ